LPEETEIQRLLREAKEKRAKASMHKQKLAEAKAEYDKQQENLNKGRINPMAGLITDKKPNKRKS
jgi:hypothetical protein